MEGFGDMGEEVRLFSDRLVDEIDSLIRSCRGVFGYISKAAICKSLGEQELFLFYRDGHVAGFIRFHHRRDGQTTVYEIAVLESYRGVGIGRWLLSKLLVDCEARGQHKIVAKCPADLPSNDWWRWMGFTCVGTIEGKRDINIWEKKLT